MLNLTHALVGTLSAASLFVAGSASAVILAQDSYNGYPGSGGLNGQSGSGEIGFAAPWSVGTANLQVESGGILDGDAASGQGRFIPAGSSSFRSGNRQLSGVTADPSDNTFYTSHLLNVGTSGGAAGQYALVGFGTFTNQDTIEGVANFLAGSFTGYVIQDDGTADLVVRSRTGAAPGVISDVTVAEDVAGDTVQIVTAIDYNNPSDEVRYWLNPTDFTNGESGLTTSSLSSGSIPGFQLGAFGDMNRLTVATNFSNRSFFWDESTLFTEVSDIPEPASAALLGLAGLAMLRRRSA
ncbi:MAG: PEP-CTERM sorting domain-containing protein [Planctomycetota bacterium]